MALHRATRGAARAVGRRAGIRRGWFRDCRGCALAAARWSIARDRAMDAIGPMVRDGPGYGRAGYSGCSTGETALDGQVRKLEL